MDLLKHYFPLCWFKNHPLQLPSSVAFFQKNLIFYFLVEFFTQANMIPPFEAFTEVIADTALTLLFVAIILSLNHTLHNYIQVASAILVCENAVSILGVPVIVWLTVTHDWLSYTVLAILMIWDFSLITYIMKKVLAIDVFASVVVTFFYFITTYGAAYALTLAF
jgi:hypothetical protein